MSAPAAFPQPIQPLPPSAPPPRASSPPWSHCVRVVPPPPLRVHRATLGIFHPVILYTSACRHWGSLLNCTPLMNAPITGLSRSSWHRPNIPRHLPIHRPLVRPHRVNKPGGFVIDHHVPPSIPHHVHPPHEQHLDPIHRGEWHLERHLHMRHCERPPCSPPAPSDWVASIHFWVISRVFCHANLSSAATLTCAQSL